MRRLKFLLRPGWVILAALVGIFAYLCFTVLAPWQLGKNTDTERRNDLIKASLNADPIPVQDLLSPGRPTAEDDWRRVTVTGTYVPASDVLVRLRSNGGDPAYEVLTPVRLPDGRSVLVDRGYVDAINGTKPPTSIPAPPPGQVTVDGRIRLSEGTIPDRPPIDEDGYRQVYSIDSGQVSAVLGTPLTSGYVQLAENQPGGLDPVSLPQLDAGPYLSYGLQWLAFGIMAPLGLAYFVRAELLERRKEKAGKPALVSASPAPASPAPSQTTEDKLADRYGKRR
ncbi:SURF1 family protein [Antrihabitans sp. YC2-6]|uniref:SURF1 family cytochrome oxidase biogenesis protein n=1 Tax=Antrihabitans sp. YC2-6 TaxID=2799498 RepID=UPI0018F6B2AB|nr:SURF1 family protein [Antrihabitans sp. YC2-6]MBJ8344862.1 SURF1 family protein [Antrihabitans sp. YC2-6]